MSVARYLVGDVFDQLAAIPDASIDLVATSPPFWRQRAYLPADHPHKGQEIGQEATPAEFIDTLLRLIGGLRRVLAPHGSIAIELADTSAGSGGAGGDYQTGGFRDGQPTWSGSASVRKTQRVSNGTGAPIPARRDLKSKRGGDEGYMRRYAAGHRHGDLGPDQPLSKSLCMIPEAFRLALAYGVNPLTGSPSPAGRWIVRNVVDWCRPNPIPGDDGDKFRRASSDIVIATLSPRRWWDGEAVREPASPNTNARTAKGVSSRPNDTKVAPDSNRDTLAIQHSGDGTRPLYDWWAVTPQQYPGAHYAVWTPEIARRLILAMCPEQVCVTCGEPSRRIVDRAPSPVVNGNGRTAERLGLGATGQRHDTVTRDARTVGWTDCGHDSWRRGRVLDPFGGSGTTLAVAVGLGRDATGIDLDDRNLHLARDRIGMFLEVSA